MSIEKPAKLEEADGNIMRKAHNDLVQTVWDIIDVLNGNPPAPVRPDWSNDAPPVVRATGKWHPHPNSDKLVLDREDFSHTIASLTEEEKAEMEEDMAEDSMDETLGE